MPPAKEIQTKLGRVISTLLGIAADTVEMALSNDDDIARHQRRTQAVPERGVDSPFASYHLNGAVFTAMPASYSNHTSPRSAFPREDTPAMRHLDRETMRRANQDERSGRGRH